MRTTPQWTAERATPVERARRLVTAAAPHVDASSLAPLAEGWDNTVLVTADGWAFRFPRRAIALPGVRREVAVLRAIGPLLPLPVPVPQLVAQDDDPHDPWPFTGARTLAGRELAEAALPDAARTSVGSAVGAFLRVLHAPATRTAVDVDLPVDPMQRAWPRPRAAQVREDLQRLVAAGTWAGDPAVADLLDRAAELGPPVGEPVLVHGDLHVRHVLVDDGGGASGVLDWGDLCLADPAVDLSVAYSAFSGAARAALLAAYGPVDAERELRARALALRISVLLAGYAATDGRPALLAESLAGLHRAAR